LGFIINLRLLKRVAQAALFALKIPLLLLLHSSLALEIGFRGKLSD
jgi:hypothetical protein